MTYADLQCGMLHSWLDACLMYVFIFYAIRSFIDSLLLSLFVFFYVQVLTLNDYVHENSFIFFGAKTRKFLGWSC